MQAVEAELARAGLGPKAGGRSSRSSAALVLGLFCPSPKRGLQTVLRGAGLAPDATVGQDTDLSQH